MVGGIKASSPSVTSISAEDLLLDLPTMSAPSGEEHAPVERAALRLRRFSGAQPGVRWVRR